VCRLTQLSAIVSIVRSQHTLTRFFQAAPKLFGGQFTFLRCSCGSGFLAGFWFFSCFPDQRDKPLEGILTVFLLASETSGLDDQDAFCRDPFSGQSFQAKVDLGGKTAGLQGIEAKLDRRGNLVHILATRSGCPNEIEGHITFMDLNVRCDLNHEGILRYQVCLDKRQSHGCFLFCA